MPVPLFQLGYQKLSQITFEWQAEDKAALLALFMAIEVCSHWLWGCCVWWHQETTHTYVNLALLYPLWIAMSITGLFFLGLGWYFSHLKNNANALYRWQIVLILVYTTYLATIIVMMGYTSLVAGISIVGGAMLSMMLIRRRYVWRLFLLQISLIVLAILSPYFGISLPSLRPFNIAYPLHDSFSYLSTNEMSALKNAVTTTFDNEGGVRLNNLNEIQRASVLFWRSTHIYLALPKAIFMVYAFRKLLQILDDSKRQILTHANQDELTGLKNRRYGLSQMRKALRDSKTAQDYSVILMDLDLFKNINDKYGHKVGDQVLSEIARVLLSAWTEGMIVSRYGGEEFLIVLPHSTHTHAMTIAEQLRQDIAQHVIFVCSNIRFSVTASFGIYTLTYSELTTFNTYPPCALESPAYSTVAPLKRPAYKQKLPAAVALAHKPLSNDICQSLISIADKALYEAKDRGRNQVVSANELLAAGIIEAPYYGT